MDFAGVAVLLYGVALVVIIVLSVYMLVAFLMRFRLRSFVRYKNWKGILVGYDGVAEVLGHLWHSPVMIDMAGAMLGLWVSSEQRYDFYTIIALGAAAVFGVRILHKIARVCQDLQKISGYEKYGMVCRS